MSLFAAERPDPGAARPPWRSCRDCRRKDCPYAYEQAVYRAAAQGRASAQLLTAEADRLRATVAAAGDVRSLLRGGEAMEQALAQALNWETSLLRELCLPGARRCP
ncbi:MAG: hypothetical protein ACI3WR_00160 [Oscillospiraceae bacterium]